MSDQPLTKRQETRLLRAYRRVLLGGAFPNPNRAGCPGSETLRAMAFRKLEQDKVQDCIEHLGTCSPCFCEYTEFREQLEWRRNVAYVGLAAAVVLVVLSFAWWGWRPRHPVVIAAHNRIVADLRNRFTSRGEQGNEPSTRPLAFKRGIDEVTIYLPEGSRKGTYEVAVLREDLGEQLASTTTEATLHKGMTELHVTLNLSRIPSGHYLLGIRLPGIEWSYYRLVVE
jgi:hypothetical protein